MAVYVVEIKLPYESYSSRFGVFHSNTETMFAPTFGEDEQLIAHMFAYKYGHNRLLSDYSEPAQVKLVSEIRLYLDERFPQYRDTLANLPAAWIELLQQVDSDITSFTSVDLIDHFESEDSAADAIMHDFYQWRKAQHAEAK